MKHGLQSQIAREVGIKPQTLNDYLAGRSGASGKVAKKLAARTGTGVELWLTDGDLALRRAAIEGCENR